MSTKLHEAVHRTANKLLDTPDYVELTREPPTEVEVRLYAALGKLGYVKLNPLPEAKTWGSRNHTGAPLWLVHPSARRYFKRYGERYVQLLEATQRLTQ
jgi:hypothetical protein